MLIFVKGHYVALIADGRKTTTIRPWKTCKLRPGAVLSFNGRLRARLTAAVPGRLGDVTAADARADGFATLREFRAAFLAHYPASTDDTPIWTLHFAHPTAAR
jgi:hypothetical protein